MFGLIVFDLFLFGCQKKGISFFINTVLMVVKKNNFNN